MLLKLLASLLCAAAAVAMRSWDGHPPAALWLPAGLLAAAAVLIHHRHLGSQLLSRAVLWSNLLLGTLACVLSTNGDRPVGLTIAWTTGAALLILGRRGMEEGTPGAFSPVAFRGTLLGLMVMALADAQTLLLFGTLGIEDGYGPARHMAWAFMGFGGMLLLSIIGLYRLRLWGLLLSLASGATLAGLMIAGPLDIGRELKLLFVGSAALQLVIAAPLFFALFTRGRRRPTGRLSIAAGAIFVVALMGLSGYAFVAHLRVY